MKQRCCDWQGGSGKGWGLRCAAGTCFHPQSLWEEPEPLWWTKPSCPGVASKRGWWWGVAWNPHLETWGFFQNFDFIRTSLVMVFDQIRVSLGSTSKLSQHLADGESHMMERRALGGSSFLCFEIITALPLFCQTCLKFVAVNSPWFILSGFLSDLDLRSISSWHLLSSDSSTVINPRFFLPAWSLLMLLNPRSMGAENSCPQPCPESVLALTEG